MIHDQLLRPLGSVRISVTDRCNLRCGYCMPEAEYTWLPRASLLTFEEITRLSRIFSTLGVRKVRITGGEPLLRRGLDSLIQMIARDANIDDLALTTNGMLLAPLATTLRAAGLSRITISLDTLVPSRMAEFARSPRHHDVVAGIDAAVAAGFPVIKLNTVVVRGYNDDELATIADFAWARGLEPRFIEYMDVGGATRWTSDAVVTRGEIIAHLERTGGRAAAVSRGDNPSAPAERFVFANGKTAGVVASTSAPFCRDCDRGRVTADGMMFLCLYATDGIDLRTPLRGGADEAELRGIIADAWRTRSDRGAEARLAVGARGALVAIEGLRADPRREMHVRGG